MATDIIQIFAEILKITPELVDKYTARGPAEAVFYLFFVPMLFLIIFVWMIGNRFITRTPIFSLLISVAVFAFIVFQGWYSFFVSISELWIILLIVLGFFYIIFRRGEGGGGGGKVKGRGFFEGVGGQVAGRAWTKLTGQDEEAESRIETLLDGFEKLKPGDRGYAETMVQIREELDKLSTMVRVKGAKVSPGKYNQLYHRFRAIAHKKGSSV